MDYLDELEVLEDDSPRDPDMPSPSPGQKLRPEAIMGIIAGACALLVAVLLVVCWPYIFINDDPEAPKYLPQLQATQPQDLPEPPVFQEKPEDPTIPPDKNPFDRNDFQYNHRNYLLLQNLPSSPGVDVSTWQGEIDWETVAASGIEFAFVRIGVRGYESGKISEDKYGEANLTGAAEAGLKVGVYFFSQALSIKEADQEIDFILDFLDGRKPDLPVVLDWEIPASNARTANMDRRTLTDIQKHFIARMKEAGLEALVYFTPYQSNTLYYLDELEEAPFWLAHYQDRMTYPWKVEYWQYTDKGRVPGINGPVDLNVYMPD